jgi:intracellular sulfur oxidation DsrE/DsrF family protein
VTLPNTVFHVPEGDRQYGWRALRNVEHFLEDDRSADVAVVFNGGGIEHLRQDAPARDRVSGLLDRGVELCLCANTIDSKDYDRESFPEGVTVVDSGVAELARRQGEGWAYVRP